MSQSANANKLRNTKSRGNSTRGRRRTVNRGDTRKTAARKKGKEKTANRNSRTKTAQREQPRRQNSNYYKTREAKLLAHKKAVAKKRRQRTRNRLLALLFSTVVVIFVCFQAVAAVIRYIENSREIQRESVEIIETVDSNQGQQIAEALPNAETAVSITRDASLTEAVESETSIEEESSTESETEASDPTKLFSGGRYIDTTKPMIAFTFDDGPSPSVEARILSALEAVDGRATFFYIGQTATKYPEQVQDVYNRGHEIANHTWSHNQKMRNESVEYISDEFTKNDGYLSELIGAEIALIRLPGGGISDNVRAAAKKPMIYWTIDTLDWKTKDRDSVIATIRGIIKDGDIVLMHSLYESTAEACEVLIPELAAEGYQFVTVSELISLRGPNVVGGNGKQYVSFPPLAEEEESTEAESIEETSEVQTESETQQSESEMQQSENETRVSEMGSGNAGSTVIGNIESETDETEIDSILVGLGTKID